MSDAERRLRIIAIGFAGVALVVALIAVVIVVQRGDSAPKKPVDPPKPAVAPLSDHKVLATDVVRLQQHGAVEPVISNGQTSGVRVKDDALARSLGLESGDVITTLSGRPLLRDLDVYDAIFNVSMMSATTLYAEVLHDNTPTLVRWRLDGDLRQARYGASGSTLGLLGGTGSGGLYTPPPPDPPDPLLDTIEKVDDTHVKMPRKTAEHFIQNPMAAAKGARVVPAMKNGKPDGLKLYAIRPSSLYAKIGLYNGDAVHSINGIDVSTPDKMLEAYMKLKDAKEFTLDITRRGQPVTQVITITK
ncbi:MAG TPA: type II secretion system protein GspC [Kofleriaceae bacterium]|nr:type II secretion system protein GspC [Kofleriaceae bacterium]